jgi:sulfur-oxidizing protein SoxA
MRTILWPVALALAVAAGGAAAQKSASQAIDEYRAMLADGNPADLFEAKGEGLWKQQRGPKNASLERCDLGKGPGVVKGAFVELPRYFADTGKVQDLETRLVTCMERLQGFDRRRHRRDGSSAAARWPRHRRSPPTWRPRIGGPSQFNLPQAHRAWSAPSTRPSKRIWSSCAAAPTLRLRVLPRRDGKRIRLQDLPNLTKNPGRRRRLRGVAGLHASPTARCGACSCA